MIFSSLTFKLHTIGLYYKIKSFFSSFQYNRHWLNIFRDYTSPAAPRVPKILWWCPLFLAFACAITATVAKLTLITQKVAKNAYVTLRLVCVFKKSGRNFFSALMFSPLYDKVVLSPSVLLCFTFWIFKDLITKWVWSSYILVGKPMFRKTTPCLRWTL